MVGCGDGPCSRIVTQWLGSDGIANERCPTALTPDGADNRCASPPTITAPRLHWPALLAGTEKPLPRKSDALKLKTEKCCFNARVIEYQNSGFLAWEWAEAPLC